MHHSVKYHLSSSFRHETLVGGQAHCRYGNVGEGVLAKLKALGILTEGIKVRETSLPTQKLVPQKGLQLHVDEPVYEPHNPNPTTSQEAIYDVFIPPIKLLEIALDDNESDAVILAALKATIKSIRDNPKLDVFTNTSTFNDGPDLLSMLETDTRLLALKDELTAAETEFLEIINQEPVYDFGRNLSAPITVISPAQTIEYEHPQASEDGYMNINPQSLSELDTQFKLASEKLQSAQKLPQDEQQERVEELVMHMLEIMAIVVELDEYSQEERVATFDHMATYIRDNFNPEFIREIHDREDGGLELEKDQKLRICARIFPMAFQDILSQSNLHPAVEEPLTGKEAEEIIYDETSRLEDYSHSTT